MTSVTEQNPTGSSYTAPSRQEGAGGAAGRVLLVEAVLGVLLLTVIGAIAWLVYSMPSTAVSGPIAKPFFSVLVPKGWHLEANARDFVDLSRGGGNRLTLFGGKPKGVSAARLDTLLCGTIKDIPTGANAIDWALEPGISSPAALATGPLARQHPVIAAPPGSILQFRFTVTGGSQEGPVQAWTGHEWVAVTDGGRHIYNVTVRDTPGDLSAFLRTAVPVALATHWTGWRKTAPPPQTLHHLVATCLKSEQSVRRRHGEEAAVMRDLSAS